MFATASAAIVMTGLAGCSGSCKPPATVRTRPVVPQQRIRLLPTEAGIVLFITIPVAANASLAEAHRDASELEEVLRHCVPQIADVVVYTKP